MPQIVWVVLWECAVSRDCSVEGVFDSEKKAIAWCVKETAPDKMERTDPWVWRGSTGCYSIDEKYVM